MNMGERCGNSNIDNHIGMRHRGWKASCKSS
jgi:hypothetical protein